MTAKERAGDEAGFVSNVILTVDAGLLAWAITGLFTLAMVRRQRLAMPNARSLHAVPVPNGGGIGIVLTVLTLWPLWSWPVPLHYAVVLAGFVMLALVSWLDDRSDVSPFVRLAVHGLAVGLCLAGLSPDARLVPAVPLEVERGLLALAWLWFTNLYNFMDGADGLAGSQAVFLALGYIAVLSVAGQESPLAPLALIVAAASLGYLIWNWHPARVFMGDIGSIPLGFLLGWLMIDLGLRGCLAAAIILPLYFCADTTLTLAWRLMRGRDVSQAHRDHFYQRAVLAGSTHADVTLRVIALDCLLLLLALVSVRRPIFAVIAAAAAVAALLGHFSAIARQAPATRNSPQLDSR
jgi:UDP-N-acetylmuramyl pentapeptide phosphotransferase/UDP-N-acetylglucosamine-1-phosphate transferase